MGINIKCGRPGQYARRIALLLFLFCGCNPQPTDSEIRILVAASAQNVTQQVVDSFRRTSPAHSQVQIVLIGGPSNGLARQIQAGSGGHLFISANPAWTDSIKEHYSDCENMLSNRLVLASPRSSSINSLSDLSGSEVDRIAVAAKSVPVGQYAHQVIDGLAESDRELLSSKLVFAKDASALVAWLENGDVDAAFVYASDIHASEILKAAAVIEPDKHDPIIYTIAKLNAASGKSQPLVDELYSWFRSDESRTIFQEAGFTLPPERLSKAARSTTVEK